MPMNSEFVVRAAEIEDTPAILAMLAELAAFEGAQHPPRVDATSLRRDAFGTEPRLHVLVAEGSDSNLVGFVTLYPNYSTWEGAPGFHIGDLWVSQESRGLGIAAALIREVVLRCLEQGGRRVDAFVLRDNPARGFYERLGFRERDEWSLYRLDAENLARIADATEPNDE
jgi:ribosomal protein S18 acetylase RimI-like enzyme